MLTRKAINDIAFRTVGCAIEVHKQLGPGLLESVYQECMIEELSFQGLGFRVGKPVALFYRGKPLRNKLFLDLIVEDAIIVELKAIEALAPVHKAQLLSYLKLSNIPKGVLINFHVENIVQHAIHLVTDRFAKLPA